MVLYYKAEITGCFFSLGIIYDQWGLAYICGLIKEFDSAMLTRNAWSCYMAVYSVSLRCLNLCFSGSSCSNKVLAKVCEVGNGIDNRYSAMYWQT